MEFLILAAIIGASFGLGYGTRELVSRQRRYRRRLGLQEWPGEAVPRPKPALQIPKPVEPPADVAIDLDRLQTAANDDRAGRHRRSQGGQRVDPGIRRDELDLAVQDLLVELNRLSSPEAASAHHRHG